MAKNKDIKDDFKDTGITDIEQKLLFANDEISLHKSFIAALISENDLLLNSNKRLHTENANLKQRVATLEEELRKFTEFNQ